MSSVNQWVEEAIEILHFPAAELQETEAVVVLRLIQEIRQRFIRGNPRAWWLSLKVPFTTYVIENRYDISGSVDYLVEVLPSKESFYFFIPENETGEYRVFQATLSAIKKILLECPFFEYYLLPPNLSWLLCENDHHGEIIISWFNS